MWRKEVDGMVASNLLIGEAGSAPVPAAPTTSWFSSSKSSKKVLPLYQNLHFSDDWTPCLSVIYAITTSTSSNYMLRFCMWYFSIELSCLEVFLFLSISMQLLDYIYWSIGWNYCMGFSYPQISQAHPTTVYGMLMLNSLFAPDTWLLSSTCRSL